MKRRTEYVPINMYQLKGHPFPPATCQLPPVTYHVESTTVRHLPLGRPMADRKIGATSTPRKAPSKGAFKIRQFSPPSRFDSTRAILYIHQFGIDLASLVARGAGWILGADLPPVNLSSVLPVPQGSGPIRACRSLTIWLKSMASC